MAEYVIVRDKAALDAALSLARGHYQRGILAGSQRLSGADLAGKARRFGGHYMRSRNNLLARLAKAAIPFSIEFIERRKTLIIGE